MKNSNQTTFTQPRDGQTKSPWQEINIDLPQLNNYDTNIIYDVLIVGGGITGLTAALMLQKEKKSVLIVEAFNVGFGTTGGTTAHINTFFDATYPEIEKDFDLETSKLVAKAGIEALDTIKSLVATLNIDCDLEFKDGYLYSETEKETKELEEIFEAAKRAGVNVSKASENGLPIDFDTVLKFSNQAQFHPLKYSKGLASEFIKNGGTILENTGITELSQKEDVLIATGEGVEIRYKDLIYATHIPPGINLFSFRCAPYRSYVIGVKLKDETKYPSNLAYDMQEPYHYFRTHEIEGEKCLIIGGEDHKTGHDDPEEAFANLEQYIRKYFDVAEVTYKWSSQYYQPVDGLPYVGQMPMGNDHTYIATGYNGNGMTFGTISGKILSDQISGKNNEFTDVFNPSRLKPIAGFTEFVKENADVAYHFVADRFGTKTLETFNDMKPGTGEVREYEGEKIAIYKDNGGKVHALSPTCTHAGCIVKFNAAETTWDCPCHGGRFDIDGKVLTGPPRKELEKIQI